MSFVLQPIQLYFLILAGWVNRQQQDVINHLRIENPVLKDKLGKKRILLNNDQRRKLAVSGKVLGRKLLEEFGTLFTPDTLLRWHRQLVAKKWDYSERKEKKPGRPRIRQVIVDLTVQVHWIVVARWRCSRCGRVFTDLPDFPVALPTLRQPEPAALGA